MWKIFSFILLFSLNSNAQIGAAADALGGAGIGAVNSLDSALLNPAALTQLREYNFGFHYFRGNYEAADHLNQYGLTITDSGMDTVLPGAFVFRHKEYDLRGQRIREQFFQLGTAYAIKPTLAAGFNVYTLRTNQSDAAAGDYNQTNVDLSLFWKYKPNLSLGLLTKGVFGSKDVDIPESAIIPSGGAGVEYSYEDILRLRGDATYAYEQNPDHRWIHNLGAEFLLSNDFILRGGYKIDDFRGESYYSAGLGWNGPRLRVAYAYQSETRRDLGTAHTVDIWINL